MADFSNLGFTSSPYIDQQVQDALGDTTRAYNLTTQPAYNAAMVNSGSFGNSGVQQMNQEAQRQLQTSLGRQANDMRSNNLWQGMGFDANNYWQNQNFDRGVYNDGVQQNQQQFQNGMNLLGLQNQTNSQNLGLGSQIQNTPLNYYGQFANQANAFGQGYGTQTGMISGQSSPLMGALGGAQLGGAFAKSWGGGGGGNYGFTGGGTPDMSGGTNGNGGWASYSGTAFNNPSAYSTY